MGSTGRTLLIAHGSESFLFSPIPAPPSSPFELPVDGAYVAPSGQVCVVVAVLSCAAASNVKKCVDDVCVPVVIANNLTSQLTVQRGTRARERERDRESPNGFGCFDGTRKITRKSTGYEKCETRNLANNPVGEKTRGGHSGHLALAKYRTTICFLFF